MKFNKENLFGATIFIAVTILFLWTLPFFTKLTGGQIYNSTEIVNTTVNITNSAPLVSTVTLDDPITLIAYGNKTVTCNATVFDYDNDTVTLNATMFYEGIPVDNPNDNNNHYTNTSCTLVNKIDEIMNFTCSFSVKYHANNGTWYCNVTALDDDNAANTNESSGSTLDPIVAIYIPGIIDFGDLAQGQISGDILSNITNVGNRDTNISVKGWGTTQGDLLAMDCQFGSIPLQWERYNISSGSTYANMDQISDTSTMIPNFYVFQQTNDSLESINSTYWRLRIPVAAGGICNGKVLFTGSDRGN